MAAFIPYRLWVALMVTPLVAGCLPRLLTLNDGVSATVIDAVSEKPIEGALVYSNSGAGGHRRVTTSDAAGRISAASRRTLAFVPLLGEGRTMVWLWVCKEGYVPQTLADRSGWNSDFSTPTHDLKEPVRLQRAPAGKPSGCDTPAPVLDMMEALKPGDGNG